MTEKEFVRMVKEVNGRVFLVGGYVRDFFLGKNPKDKDYVITGVTEEMFKRLFPFSEKVGNSFPVYLLDIDGESCEIAFARKERKVGTGYKGFEVLSSSDITIEEDLYRRDTTMNSIAMELPNRNIIDPYNGIFDIKSKIIKATSIHFLEDPIRAVRASRQASQHGFMIENETYKLMNLCKEELKLEPTERILEELKKVLLSNNPSIFFKALIKADLLDILFFELNLVYENDKDFFFELLNKLDNVKVGYYDKKFVQIIRFIILINSFRRLYSVQKSLDLLDRFNKRITLPNSWIKIAKFFLENVNRNDCFDTVQIDYIIKIILDLKKLQIPTNVIHCIFKSLFDLVPKFILNFDSILKILLSVSGNDSPKNLIGKDIGLWILKRREELLKDNAELIF